MRKRLLYIGLALSCALVGGQLLAAAPDGRPAAAAASTSFDVNHWINANKFMGFITNEGGLFRDFANVFGYNYGSFYPYTSIADIQSGANVTSPIFAAGLWMGGMVGVELRVTIADYACEYAPGPMQSGTYLPDNTAFRVYQLYDDSLAGNPNTDYQIWPVSQGAPLDGSGHPLSLGKQTLWTVYNDADPVRHNTNAGGTNPFGIEVQQTVYANDGPYYEDNAMYIQYVLRNKGDDTVDAFYLAFWLDPDLGGAGDDLVGCDTINDLFYCYNADNTDLQYGNQPPAVGVKVLGGPVVPSSGDTAIFNGKKVPNFRNLRMTAFGKYINGTDPNSAEQAYNYMKGLLADGSEYYYNGNPLRYRCSGDPITGTGDIDAVASDRRMMGSFGPLTFHPGDSQQVLLKLAVGQGADNKSSINVMKYNLGTGVTNPCASASIRTQDFGSLSGSEFYPTASQWLKGVNWGGATFGGGIGFGRDFFGSALDPATMPDSFTNIEIRFSETVRQNAYQYIRPGYNYGGYYQVPFTVWDIDHDRQLNAAFVEWTGSRIFNQNWDLDDSAHYGGREYLVIFKSNYSGMNPYASPMNYPAKNLLDDAASLDILYAGWFALGTGRTMQDLAAGQTLSMYVQKKMPNGTGNLVLFRDTRVGDTAFQHVAVGCESSFLPEAFLTFADTTVFNVSLLPDEMYAAPAPSILHVREMANATGPVEPPSGRDVFGFANSTGDWMIDTSGATSTLIDSSGRASQDDWEIRFTAQGSWAHHTTNGTLFGHVPFELWNIGEDTRDDLSDDFQVPTVIYDMNADGNWTMADRCYFTHGTYDGTPPPTIDMP